MAELLLPKEHYQSLFDAFFAAASVNCNAFLEFRCQNNIIRAKWSDTNKPYAVADANMPNRAVAPGPDVSRPPPPSFQPIVSNSQEDGSIQLWKRRRRAAMASSSPLKAVASRKPQDDRTAPDVGGDQVPDPPEIVRECGTKIVDPEILQVSLEVASDCDGELECTRYSSEFSTPNRFEILNDLTNDEISATQDDTNTAAKNSVIISCPPCNRAHKCYECMDECLDHCEDAICPGLITMNCHVCRKSFTNQDWAKSNNRL